MKTYSPKPDHIERRWLVIDASGKVLGAVASEVAALLRGKHKPIFAPHMDTGDHVIVVNAAKIELTGTKLRDKVAYRHSGYPGGIKETKYDKLVETKPAYVIEKAVRGMLPKNRLGREIIKKLHVYAGPEHVHQAQAPVAHELGARYEWTGFPAPKEKPARRVKTAPAATPEAATKPAASKAKPAASKAKPAASKTKPAATKAKPKSEKAPKESVAESTASDAADESQTPATSEE